MHNNGRVYKNSFPRMFEGTAFENLEVLTNLALMNRILNESLVWVGSREG